MEHDDLVHRLRALTVELELLGSEFASRNVLHATDVRALIALLDRSRAGEIATPGWLAGHLGLNSASTTALIDRLEGRGLVSRARDDADRRRVTLYVTDAAQEMGWDFFGPLIDRVRTVVDDFSAAELNTVRAFLDHVTAAVGELRNA
ncbi:MULTISPECIES: MarR family winged helix-turn-helix transcriptional regulator [Gordonia]|uniref:MarR family winged helix-turn-helix transcriptional regulator n=1 Tax=Gordonia amicalis TaxID=89053 RepID=A0ABU4DFM2_9ACTN|nr:MULTISPECIES: MarR family winged helix-turn-helix transcriptional regulator [Gordonia]ATD73195.1 MarR family transcriptional regulator [Gordonia sp. 1D]MCZ0914260.1 MarR family winged helix-turn-helix transcriptional regulator [Gordonia amicalis]MDJ0453688.1 MarR family winged helix-turn-helix transcriptional regulator [Gordonia amicalis]MDV6308544.1 MarR family winged helix-turn-helix transcriptional regulator [Gordonia amicalis]MDV7078589.1 MarR family winged helix-turn-helix transcriptio